MDLVSARIRLQDVERSKKELRAFREEAAKVSREGVKGDRAAQVAANRRMMILQREMRIKTMALREERAAYREKERLEEKLARDKAKRAAMPSRIISQVAAGVAIPGLVTQVAQIIGASLQALGREQSFENMLERKFGKERAAILAFETSSFANKQGLDITQIQDAVKVLAGMEVVPADDIIPTIKAFMALGADGGAGSEEAARAFTQYLQVLAQGKLEGDELKLMQTNFVPLGNLLREAGYGDRIGSQTNPITAQEIQKVLLDYGDSPDAEEALAQAADNAASSLQRLSNVIQQEVLPTVGGPFVPHADAMSSDFWTIAPLYFNPFTAPLAFTDFMTGGHGAKALTAEADARKKAEEDAFRRKHSQSPHSASADQWMARAQADAIRKTL